MTHRALSDDPETRGFIHLFDVTHLSMSQLFGVCGDCGAEGARWRAVASDADGNAHLVCRDCLELAAILCERCQEALIVCEVVTCRDDKSYGVWNVCRQCGDELRGKSGGPDA